MSERPVNGVGHRPQSSRHAQETPHPLCAEVVAGSFVKEIDIGSSQRRILQQEGDLPAQSRRVEASAKQPAVNVVVGALIVVVVTAVTVSAMLLMRRWAPEGS